MMTYDVLKPEGFRPAVCDSKHIDTKCILKFRFLKKHVLKIFNIRIFSELKYDPYAFFTGLVGYVDYIGCLLGIDKSYDIKKEL